MTTTHDTAPYRRPDSLRDLVRAEARLRAHSALCVITYHASAVTARLHGLAVAVDDVAVDAHSVAVRRYHEAVVDEGRAEHSDTGVLITWSPVLRDELACLTEETRTAWLGMGAYTLTEISHLLRRAEHGTRAAAAGDALGAWATPRFERLRTRYLRRNHRSNRPRPAGVARTEAVIDAALRRAERVASHLTAKEN